jgi:hypothetical protein
LACLSKIRYGANRAEALERNRIKGRSKGKGAFGAARFSGATKEQARGGEIAIGK